MDVHTFSSSSYVVESGFVTSRNSVSALIAITHQKNLAYKVEEKAGYEVRLAIVNSKRASHLIIQT